MQLVNDAIENSPESRERVLNILTKKELALKVFGEMRNRYISYGNIPVTKVWLNNYRQTDKMPRAIVEYIDAPFDIKSTLAMFAKEKGLSIYDEPRLLTGLNPLDKIRSDKLANQLED